MKFEIIRIKDNDDKQVYEFSNYEELAKELLNWLNMKQINKSRFDKKN